MFYLLKKQSKKNKQKKGISLVEMLVAVATIGALVAISIPSYSIFKKKSKISKLKVDLIQFQKAWMSVSIYDKVFCSDGKYTMFTVGLQRLYESGDYGSKAPRIPNFIGFGRVGSRCDATELLIGKDASGTPKKLVGLGANKDGSIGKDVQCILGKTTFKAGIFHQLEKDIWGGFSVNEDGNLSSATEVTGPIRVQSGSACS